MKSPMSWVWFIISLALAALLLIETRQNRRQKLKLEEVQIQLEKAGKQSESRVKELERERMQLRGQLQAAENELSTTRAAYTALAQMTNSNAALPGGNRPSSAVSAFAQPRSGMGTFLGEMLKDPEMRKAMEQQQKLAMDMMYASLLKRLQLTPEQEKQFKQLLLDQQMANISQAGNLMDAGSTNRTEALQKLAEQREKMQGQIKELLGEEKFAQYEDYNQTIGERMMLEQFGKQIELSPEQTDQVLNIMREEKKNAQINSGTPSIDPNKDFQKVMADPEVFEKLLAQQEQANQRVLERAGQVLTPEQLQKLGPALQSQLEMQRAGMKMARQMFGSPEAPAPNAPPAPEAQK